ncbi:MAG: hypothetical protein KIS92_26005 [Planctomycetota bacterium]|nr:hypothetical protein [Planctomycetota bacterium]
MLLVIFIMGLLMAAMGYGMARLRTRAHVASVKGLLEKVKNGLATYKLVYRDFPDPVPLSGFNENETVYFFLTRAFRRAPDGAKGEIYSTENVGPLSEFNERDQRIMPGRTRVSIVDAWNEPLVFKYVGGRPALYSKGPNHADDNAGADDLVASE